MFTVKDGIKLGFGMLLVHGAWMFIEEKIDETLNPKHPIENGQTAKPEQDKIVVLNRKE